MGTGRGHEPVAPIQARDAGTTSNSPKKGGYHSASENPIGIETFRWYTSRRWSVNHSASENPIGIETTLRIDGKTPPALSQRIRKPDRD